MRVYNSADSSAYVVISGSTMVLKPNESTTVDCSGTITVELKHDYSSTAMPEKEIARDHQDDSMTSLLFSAHEAPYFHLVLDCKYQIVCDEKTEITILKEIIRPTFACSYDRLYPAVNIGTVKELSCVFQEEKQFKKHYLNAISRGNKKILAILLIDLAVAILPAILICFLVNWMLGLLGLLGAAAVLAGIYFLGMLFSKLLCKADCAVVFSDFESDRIIECFSQQEKK